jgi:cell pole-organizing protein PopZ
MSDAKAKPAAGQAEPSMEEILASIRRIISDESPESKAAPAAQPTPQPAAAPAGSDVLELTEVVDEKAAEPAEAPAPQPAPPVSPPAAAPAPQPATVAVPIAATSGDGSLVSTGTATAAAGAFASLVSAKRQQEQGMTDNPLPLGQGGLTVEAIVREELRPILKAWLDQNLAPMVERMVQKEIQKIAGGG